METKNVLIAVILSTLVLVFWSTFFEPPINEDQFINNEMTSKQETSSPSLSFSMLTGSR